MAADAWATRVRPFPLPAMVRDAHAIVRGEVIDEEVVFDPAWGQVYTHSSVRVDEVLQGRERVGEVIVVRQIGGELDGLSREVVGTARLHIGAEVVLFARTDGAFHYLIGMAQGVYAVDRSVPGRVSLIRSLGGLKLMDLPGPAAPLPPSRWGLDELRASVNALRGTR
jgi:hypothetical protein